MKNKVIQATPTHDGVPLQMSRHPNPTYTGWYWIDRVISLFLFYWHGAPKFSDSNLESAQFGNVFIEEGTIAVVYRLNGENWGGSRKIAMSKTVLLTELHELAEAAVQTIIVKEK